MQNIDIKENSIHSLDQELLDILLRDYTMRNLSKEKKTSDLIVGSKSPNILWATDAYEELGKKYAADMPITARLVTGKNGEVIKPRVEKAKEEQRQRSKDKAEVFTPSWVCNAQNNLIDCAWFDRKTSPFNKETDNGWVTRETPIKFLKKTWQDYVKATRMEVSCGEAPYITSRYDTVTGETIPVRERIGLLDRKLRIVSENCASEDEWIEWAIIAVKNIYAFEWQGDNILLARENILFNVNDYFTDKFGKELSLEHLKSIAEIIGRNIVQMDGINFTIPGREMIKKVVNPQQTFQGEITEMTITPIYARVTDWETGKTVRFADIVKEEK